ncbi:MAG: ribosome silencing factor [Gemmatimonadales bacterium]
MTSGSQGRGRSRRASPRRSRPAEPNALRLVADALADRKAVEPLILDLRGLCSATDYFVIASGSSDAHVRGMAEHVMTALAPHGAAPHHVEGLSQGHWVLLDYVDFVVHLFHPQLREFYQLERLWGDAPVVAAGDPEAKG